MAIIWNESTDHTGALKDTYEGRVLSEHTEYDVRIMSDVYSHCYSAKVWTGTEVTEISTGTQEFGMKGNVTVDATPETLEAVKAWEDAKEAERLAAWEAAAPEREAARLKAEAEEKATRIKNALSWLKRPLKGRTVKVVRRRGRNAPPLNTEGVVIWTGTSGFGTERVGIKDANGTVHWTTAGNCEAELPADAVAAGKDADALEAVVNRVKGEDLAAAAKREAERHAKADIELDALPDKGKWVRLCANHEAFGKVFWRGVTRKGSARIGFKADRNGEAHWAGFRNGVCEAEVLSGDPRKGNVTVNGRIVLAGAAAPASEPAVKIAELPAPFNRIASIRPDGRAFDSAGVFIAALPEATATKFRSALV